MNLILWTPLDLAAWVDYFSGPARLTQKGVKDINEETKNILSAIPIPAPGSIDVQLLQHPDPTGSYHEKAMIFAECDENVKVIVGGLNISGEYRDAAPHANLPNWHDVAVQFWGPATTDVERDFINRWALTDKGGALRGPSSSPPRQGDQSVAVKVTDGSKHEIRAELLARIKAAERFIYMENFSIHDPDLLTAIGERLGSKRDRGEPFEVILLINSKESKGDLYSWLHFVTYTHLSFKSCSAFYYYDNKSGIVKKVTRKTDGKTKWSFNYAGNWYYDSTVTWDTGSTHITQIEGIEGDTPLYRLVNVSDPQARPASMLPVYVHSKVSIFDDEIAGIGSANFNPRSMEKDGELTAFISGDSVRSFRDALWSEYFSSTGSIPTPATWKALARKNVAKLSDGSTIRGQLYVLPVSGSEYEKEPPKFPTPLTGAKDY